MAIEYYSSGGLNSLDHLNAGTNINIGGTPTVPIINVVDNPTFAGLVTLQNGMLVTAGDIQLYDNLKLSLGTGNDFQLYHDGSKSYITSNVPLDIDITGAKRFLGTGNLSLGEVADGVSSRTIVLQTRDSGYFVTIGADHDTNNAFYIEHNASRILTSTSDAYQMITLGYVGGLAITLQANNVYVAKSLNITNQGAGTAPVLFSNSAGQRLDLTGYLVISDFLQVGNNLIFKSGTSFTGSFDHAITANRIFTFQDKSYTVAGLDDITSAISGTVGTIPVFTGANAIGDSIISESGSVITVAGTLTVGDVSLVSNGLSSATSFLHFRVPAGQNMYFDAGGLFQFRDQDDSDALLFQLDTSGRALAIGTASDTIATTLAGSLTITNLGAGSDPVFNSNSAAQSLALTGIFEASGWIQTDSDFYFKSGTGFFGQFAHSITAGRTFTLQDKDYTIAGLDDIASAVSGTVGYIPVFTSSLGDSVAQADSYGILLGNRSAGVSYVLQFQASGYDLVWFYQINTGIRIWNSTDSKEILLIDFDTGAMTVQGNISLVNDNQYILLGAGNDLQFYHNGSHSFINNNTGNLEFNSSAFVFDLGGIFYIRDSDDSDVTLFEFNTSTRILTLGQTADTITTTLKGWLQIQGDVDSPLSLDALDDSWAYISFRHSGVRKAYVGINSTPDLKIIAEAGDVDIAGTEVKLTGITKVTGTLTITDTFTTANSNNLGSLTTVEVTQLLNIDSTTVSTTQWGYLGALDQGLTTASNVVFANALINQLTIVNASTGADPVLLSGSGIQKLNLTGRFQISENLELLSGTSYIGGLQHNNTGHQYYNFPDKTGTMAMLDDITGAISGTTGTIPVFTGVNAIGDSLLTYDTATNQANLRLSGGTDSSFEFGVNDGGVASNNSSRLFFREVTDYGFSIIMAGADNPTLIGDAFTLSGNTLYFINHNASATGSVMMSFDRVTGNVSFGAIDVNFANGTLYKITSAGNAYFKDLYIPVSQVIHVSNHSISGNANTHLYIDTAAGTSLYSNTSSLIVDLQASFQLRDRDDSDATLLNFDTSARTLVIGDSTDLMQFAINATVSASRAFRLRPLADNQRAMSIVNFGDTAEIISLWSDASGNGLIAIANTSNVVTINLNSAGSSYFKDNLKISADSKGLYIGAGDDFNIQHDGTNTLLSNSTGVLYIDNIGRNVISNAGAFYFDLAGSLYVRDYDDGDVTLFEFNTNARTLTIGGASDNIATTINGVLSITDIFTVTKSVVGDFTALHLKNTFGGGSDQTSVQLHFNTGHNISFASAKLIFKEADTSDYRTNMEIHLVDSHLDEEPTLAMTLGYQGNLTVVGAITGTAFGGILSANLLDKSATEIITGSWNFDTDTGNQKFYITRLGSADQGLAVHVDDGAMFFEYAQDEVATEAHSVRWNITSGASGAHYYNFSINTAQQLAILGTGIVVANSVTFNTNLISSGTSLHIKTDGGTNVGFILDDDGTNTYWKTSTRSSLYFEVPTGTSVLRLTSTAVYLLTGIILNLAGGTIYKILANGDAYFRQMTSGVDGSVAGRYTLFTDNSIEGGELIFDGSTDGVNMSTSSWNIDRYEDDLRFFYAGDIKFRLHGASNYATVESDLYIVDVTNGVDITIRGALNSDTNTARLILEELDASDHHGGRLVYLGTSNVLRLETFSTTSTWICFDIARNTGVLTFTSFPITPSAAPTTDYQTANKKYVDDTAGGVNYTIDQTYVRTTASAGTYTYTSTEDLHFIIQGDRNNDDEAQHAWFTAYQDGTARWLHMGVGENWNNNNGFIASYGSATEGLNFCVGATFPNTAIIMMLKVGTTTVPSVAIPKGHAGTSWGLTQEVSLELGQSSGDAGRIKLWGGNASDYGSIMMTTENMHLDCVGGGSFYFGNYDNSVVYFNGSTYYINGGIWKADNLTVTSAVNKGVTFGAHMLLTTRGSSGYCYVRNAADSAYVGVAAGIFYVGNSGAYIDDGVTGTEISTDWEPSTDGTLDIGSSSRHWSLGYINYMYSYELRDRADPDHKIDLYGAANYMYIKPGDGSTYRYVRIYSSGTGTTALRLNSYLHKYGDVGIASDAWYRGYFEFCYDDNGAIGSFDEWDDLALIDTIEVEFEHETDKHGDPILDKNRQKKYLLDQSGKKIVRRDGQGRPLVSSESLPPPLRESNTRWSRASNIAMFSIGAVKQLHRKHKDLESNYLSLCEVVLELKEEIVALRTQLGSPSSVRT